jgi:hypothetical protein
MDYSDFIIDEDLLEQPEKEDKADEEIKGEYSEGDEILINTEKYTILEFIEAKEITDNLGFPVIYSWYKATDPEENGVDLFFFDGDIDNIDTSGNEKLCRKWFEDYGVEAKNTEEG